MRRNRSHSLSRRHFHIPSWMFFGATAILPILFQQENRIVVQASIFPTWIQQQHSPTILLSSSSSSTLSEKNGFDNNVTDDPNNKNNSSSSSESSIPLMTPSMAHSSMADAPILVTSSPSNDDASVVVPQPEPHGTINSSKDDGNNDHTELATTPPFYRHHDPQDDQEKGTDSLSLPSSSSRRRRHVHSSRPSCSVNVRPSNTHDNDDDDDDDDGDDDIIRLIPSTQKSLQTLEKLRQMLDETDYMMMIASNNNNDNDHHDDDQPAGASTSKARPTRRRQRRRLRWEELSQRVAPVVGPVVPVASSSSSSQRSSASSSSSSPQQRRQEMDQLWTSKDRSKYKRQQRRGAGGGAGGSTVPTSKHLSTTSLLRQIPSRQDEQLQQSYRLTMPQQSDYNDNDDEDDDDPHAEDDDENGDDTDDGLGYTLPNLPVYLSDQENDDHDDHPQEDEEDDESEIEPEEPPPQQFYYQHQPLPAHWPRHYYQSQEYYSQRHDPRALATAIMPSTAMTPNDSFYDLSLTTPPQYPPQYPIYYPPPYWPPPPGYQQGQQQQQQQAGSSSYYQPPMQQQRQRHPQQQQQAGGSSSNASPPPPPPQPPYFPPYHTMGYYGPPPPPPQGSYPYYPPYGTNYPLQQQNQQQQQRISPQSRLQQHLQSNAQWGARHSFLPTYPSRTHQQQQHAQRLQLRNPRPHDHGQVPAPLHGHTPEEDQLMLPTSDDTLVAVPSSNESVKDSSAQMAVYSSNEKMMLSASTTTHEVAETNAQRLTLDSWQKLSFMAATVVVMCYSAVSPRQLPLTHYYHLLAVQNLRLIGLSLLAPLFNLWLIWDKAVTAKNNVNHWMSTFFTSFTVGYLLVFGMELLATTVIRLGIFWWWERQVFDLAVPMPILPWVLREHRYRPKRITLFVADFLTTCVASPIIEEFFKLKLLQWTVQLPRNFHWTTRLSSKNSKKRRVAEPIPRIAPHEPDVINVNSYVTQMFAASLGLKLCDMGRRILMYTKAGDAHKGFYATMRGVFPIYELCGTITALGLAKRDVLGMDLPTWKILLPAIVIHGMANFRGKKPVFKWNSATPWSEMQLFPWNNDAAAEASPFRQLLSRKGFAKLMWLVLLARVLGYCIKNYFLVNRQAVKRTTTFAGNHAAFSAELAAAEALKKTEQ